VENKREFHGHREAYSDSVSGGDFVWKKTGEEFPRSGKRSESEKTPRGYARGGGVEQRFSVGKFWIADGRRGKRILRRVGLEARKKKKRGEGRGPERTLEDSE